MSDKKEFIGWLAMNGKTVLDISQPLVRCRDCAYMSRDVPSHPYCYRPSEFHEFPVEPDGFCAWASRRSE